MAGKLKRKLVNAARRILWRILGPSSPDSRDYVAAYGCIRCASSFLAWNQIDGDYLEFGVYEGRSFAEAYRSIWSARERVRRFVGTDDIERWYADRPRFFAFDSFSGLPGGEAERHADYHEGAYSCSEARFLENIESNGVSLADVVTVPGFYDETLTAEARDRLQLRKASLITIDCDLYESTVPVLDFITPLIDQGTIIVFDDWYRYKGAPDKGEQRACNEWLARNPHIELVQYWQQGPQAVAFLVNVRQSDNNAA